MPMVARCDFTNYTGTNVIRTNSISVYSSDFYNNSITSSTIRSQILKDVILDSSNMFEAISNNSSNHIVNSTITGRVDITRTAIHLLALMYSNFTI
jgi:hypothetical protein